MELRGPNLSLRYPVPEDAPRLFDLASDPGTTGWFSWGPYVDPAQPVAWIAGLEAARTAGLSLDYVIVRGGQVVGVTALNELARRDRRAMLGTWIGRPWWGTGVNAEAKALLCHLAFRVCGLERIGAYANVANVRSAVALEKIGMTREGTLRRWHRHADLPLDVHVYGLLREEFDASPLAAVKVAMVRVPPPPWAATPAATPS